MTTILQQIPHSVMTYSALCIAYNDISYRGAIVSGSVNSPVGRFYLER